MRLSANLHGEMRYRKQSDGIVKLRWKTARDNLQEAGWIWLAGAHLGDYLLRLFSEHTGCSDLPVGIVGAANGLSRKNCTVSRKM